MTTMGERDSLRGVFKAGSWGCEDGEEGRHRKGRGSEKQGEWKTRSCAGHVAGDKQKEHGYCVDRKTEFFFFFETTVESEEVKRKCLEGNTAGTQRGEAPSPSVCLRWHPADRFKNSGTNTENRNGRGGFPTGETPAPAIY